MKTLRKAFCLLLILTLSLSLFSCASAPTGDEYHDSKVIGVWEVEAWASVNYCYYPVYYTLQLNADGSAKQYMDEDQFKFNRQMEVTFDTFLYTQLLKSEVREKFYGMEKEEYLTHLRNSIADKLPDYIKSTYGKEMEAWLTEEYNNYKVDVDAGKVEKGTVYWITKDQKLALLSNLSSFEGKPASEIWTIISTEGARGCVDYAFSDNDQVITISQASDDEFHNSYPVTMLKIG